MPDAVKVNSTVAVWAPEVSPGPKSVTSKVPPAGEPAAQLSDPDTTFAASFPEARSNPNAPETVNVNLVLVRISVSMLHDVGATPWIVTVEATGAATVRAAAVGEATSAISAWEVGRVG